MKNRLDCRRSVRRFGERRPPKRRRSEREERRNSRPTLLRRVCFQTQDQEHVLEQQKKLLAIRAILRLDVKHLVTGALGCSAVLPSPKRPRRYKFYSQSPSRPQVPRAPFHPTTHRAPHPPPRPFPLPPRGDRPGPRRGQVSSVTNCSLAFPPALASSSSSRLARFPNRKQVTGRDVQMREIF